MIRGLRIVVTGGAGFIGSHLCEALAPVNEVHVLDDLSAGRRANLDGVPCTLHRVDVGDPAVRPLFRGVDCVVHLAAQVSVDRSVDEPLADARANVLGTINVLEAARAAGVRRVVLASSSAVYGAATLVPTPETAAPQPDSPYAASKLAAEEYLRTYGRLHGMASVALRFFNVYGARQDPSSPYSGVISIFADRAARGLPLTVHGDGEQTRDFIAVEDVVRACLLAAGSGVRGVFNVGTGRSLTINRLAALCAGGRVPIERGPARPGDIRRSVGDPTRAREGLGFAAQVTPEDGIRAHVERCRAAAPAACR